MLAMMSFFSQRVLHSKKRPTKRVVPALRFGGGDSSRFMSIFLASSLYYSQAESTLTTLPLSPKGDLRQPLGRPL